MIAGSNGMTAGEKRSARWRALRLGSEVKKLKALSGKLVDPARLVQTSKKNATESCF